ncbi:DUF5995 family protein [Halobellus rarus]|uniref:DUF5995 family protein n=1 Tax=Halobellus rarus TaxID=1126237 RepID=A0ABD6CVN2_9EURY
MITIHNGIPTAAELRAFALKYRRSGPDPRTTARRLASIEANEEVLEILSEPFTSVEDTHDRLVRTEQSFRERSDRRSVFLTVYTRMTAAVRSGIRSGRFANEEWARRYLVAFANYYRRALLAFERRDFEAVPAPWRIGFTASVRGDSLIAQDALSGINAHINYDLTYTLDDVGIDPDRDAKRADHDQINEVLNRLIDTVQDVLVDVYSAVGISQIDDLLGQLDEQLAFLGLTRSRQFAWRNAVLLADLPWQAIERYVDWRTQTVATGIAQFVLAPRTTSATYDPLRSAEADHRTVAAFHEAFEDRVPERLLGNATRLDHVRE